METYRFEDALTGKTVACSYPGLQAWAVEDTTDEVDAAETDMATGAMSAEIGKDAMPEAFSEDSEVADADAGAVDAHMACPSLFFPGCSLINYGLPLVKAVYDLLAEAGRVEGLSLLCCGKILSYEPDGQRVRAEFEQQMREHVVRAGVRRIVAACPNCVAALRAALACDERTAGVQVVALPQELADMGYRIDEEVLRRMVSAEAPVVPEEVTVCVHDSCPDREAGEFADGTRALRPEGGLTEAAHIRSKSFCCGSLARAAGKTEAAEKQARRHGEEAEAAGAAAIVTACVSCAFQLSVAQQAVPVFHYLELLYDWRIDWTHADLYMKLRFLFDDASDEESSGRAFVGLENGGCMYAAGAGGASSPAQERVRCTDAQDAGEGNSTAGAQGSPAESDRADG